MYRLSNFSSVVKSFLQSIFNSLVSFELKFKFFVSSLFKLVFKLLVKHADDCFFFSSFRKDNFVSRGFVQRTVSTPYGTVTFSRRKYVNKLTSKCYYIDHKFGIDKYKRLSNELIFELLYEYQFTCANRLAKKYDVSKQTIYNLVNSFQMPVLDIQRLENGNTRVVYIEIDEDHMKCKKSRNTYMRIATIHLGVEKECKGRNRLKDRHTITFPTMVNLEDVSEYILSYLHKRYDMDKKKLIVNSDGAKWITSLVDMLSIYKPIHIYDKFHLIKAIREISKMDKNISKNLYKWIKDDDFGALENFYETFKEEEKVSQRRKDLMKMILNQYEKIRRIYTEEDYIGSRTEALVSQICSRYLSSRPKAFSRKKIISRGLYLSFFANYGHNEEELRELYFRSKKTMEINEIIEIEETKEPQAELKTTTNIPYTRGKECPVREVLREISHLKII